MVFLISLGTIASLRGHVQLILFKIKDTDIVIVLCVHEEMGLDAYTGSFKC